MVATGFLKPKDSVLLCCVEGWEQRVLVLLMSSPSPTPASFHLDHPQHPCLPRAGDSEQPAAARGQPRVYVGSDQVLCRGPGRNFL